MVISIVVGVVALALGVFFGLALSGLRGRQQGAAAVASLAPVASAIQKAEEELVHQRAETERARSERDAEARKAREYFDKIEGIVKEAQECRRLLVRTGAEHGNAQAMMLREIESLSIQYRSLVSQYRKATGKAPPRAEPLLNSTIQVIAAEFLDAHVAPYQKDHAPTPLQANPQSGG